MARLVTTGAKTNPKRAKDAALSPFGSSFDKKKVSSVFLLPDLSCIGGGDDERVEIPGANHHPDNTRPYCPLVPADKNL